MRVYLILLFFIVVYSVNGAEFEIAGTYQGKDIYVRNPYMRTSGTFCVSEIYVNGQLVLLSPKITALKVDLSRFARGEFITIKIVHDDGCKPLVLNPEVLKMEREFRFLEITINNNSLNFSTQGEKRYGRYIVEKQFMDNEKSVYWEMQFEITGKGEQLLNRYSAEPRHFPGDNIYRVIYEPLEGTKVVSEEITYTSTKKPVTFFPFSVSDKITFSEYTYYEISDMNGNVLKTGSASEIYVNELKPGEYMIKIQNRYERFVKRGN